MSQYKILPIELKTAFNLALLFSLRMFGLFLVVPVLSLYAYNLHYSTAVTVGLAVGIYGLTQGLLQMPLGFLSDKIGRKPIIVGGFIVLAIGSVVAAFSSTIFGVIFGRLLQGGAAIGSTILAQAADLTRPVVRSRVMAIVGSAIGVAFAAGFVLSPLLYEWVEIEGMFILTAFLALGAAFFAYKVLPPVITKRTTNPLTLKQSINTIFSNSTLIRFNIAVFCLHAMLASLMVTLPVELREEYELIGGEQSLWYLAVIGISFVLCFPILIWNEKKGCNKKLLIISFIALLIVSLFMVVLDLNITNTSVLLALFFLFFNVIEAQLPSLVSKVAPQKVRGAAMGAFSSFQFLGVFAGGLAAGISYETMGDSGAYMIAAVCAAIAIIFLINLIIKTDNTDHQENGYIVDY